MYISFNVKFMNTSTSNFYNRISITLKQQYVAVWTKVKIQLMDYTKTSSLFTKSIISLFIFHFQFLHFIYSLLFLFLSFLAWFNRPMPLRIPNGSPSLSYFINFLFIQFYWFKTNYSNWNLWKFIKPDSKVLQRFWYNVLS